MPDIVNGILIADGQILLALRSVHRQAYPGTWSFPGGHVENGETLAEALARELGEELGIVPTSLEHLAVLEVASPSDGRINRFHIFVVRDWVGQPQLIGDEHSALRWLTPLDASRLPNLSLQSYQSLFSALTL